MGDNDTVGYFRTREVHQPIGFESTPINRRIKVTEPDGAKIAEVSFERPIVGIDQMRAVKADVMRHISLAHCYRSFRAETKVEIDFGSTDDLVEDKGGRSCPP